MRNSFALLAFAFTLAAAGARCEDSLFSQVPLDSVFSSSGASTEQGQPAAGLGQTPRRLLAAGPLEEALRQAGFEPSPVSSQAVSIKMQLDQLSIPVLVTISDDQSQLSLALMLGTVTDNKLPADKLLSLLAANREHAPIGFSYSPTRKRIELHHTLSNQGMSGEVLKLELNRLAGIAKQTQSSWNFEAPTAAAPSQAATPAPAQTTVQAPAQAPTAGPATGSLIGKWSAARSEKEAFAIQLSADSKFVLVYIKDGKQNRSSGKFTLSGQLLTLTGDDGTKLAGAVSSQSAQEFQFLPQSASGKSTSLVFKKAT